MKAGLVPELCGCILVSHRAPCLQWIPTGSRGRGDAVGSLQGWGRIWQAEGTEGLLEDLTSKSSSGDYCGAELESWNQWQLSWSNGKRRRRREEGMR